MKINQDIWNTIAPKLIKKGISPIELIVSQFEKGASIVGIGESHMVDLYVLVHVDESTMKGDPKVAKEIRRIKREERFVEVLGNPCIVDYDVPEDTNLFVCGFYHGRQRWDHRCVDEQIKALRGKGYSPQIYLPATVSLDP